jgi:hypothetical protein
MHKMCKLERNGLLDFKSIIDSYIIKIKVYHVLCHEILSMIQR